MPKKNSVAKPNTEERYAEKKFLASPFGVASQLLFTGPAATTSFVERHCGRSWNEVAAEMMRDPHIQSVFRSRRAGVAGRSWNIIPADESPQAQEIAEFIEKNLNQIPNFEHSVSHLLNAIPFGHSVAEVVWREDSDAYRVSALKTRRADRFTLSDDGKQVLVLSSNLYGKEPVEDKKIIYHQHERMDDAPFEEPLLLSLYWPWFFKKNAAGFWVVVAEKFGVPSIIGKYPQWLSDTQQTELLNALVNLQQDSVTVVPLETTIDTGLANINVGEKGSFFRELLDFCNAEISKAVLGGTLTQEIGDKGSYAASQTHQEVRQDIVEKDAKGLQSTLDATLIVWLVYYNYGEEAAARLCPGIQFNVQPNRGTPEFATTLKTLSDMGFKPTAEFISEAFGIPDLIYEKPAAPVQSGFVPGFSEKDKTFPFE